jgi:enolase
VDIQEFMIIPVSFKAFKNALSASSEVYHALGSVLKERGLSTGVGDEGGFAPDLENDEEALDLLMDAILESGYVPGRDIRIALDMATSEWVREGGYLMPKRNSFFTEDQMIEYIISLIEKYPIISVEDPLGENDFSAFGRLSKKTAIQIVGDDLFVTNPKRLLRGIEEGAANTVLIKPNQIGTLTETMQTIRLAKNNGYRTVISHRSGETADSFIADLAVAVNSVQIKTGAPARSERVSKYNRLLQIELALGDAAHYGGVQSFI